MDLFLSTMPSPLIFLSTISATRFGQQAFLYVDFLSTMIFGTSLMLTPNFLLSYQTDVRLDNVSPYLARIIGILLLSLSIQSHRAFLLNNRMRTASVFSSRAITAIMLLLATSYAAYHYREWNYKFLHLSVFGAFCWLLPHAYYSLATIYTTPRHFNAVAFFLLIDYFMTAALGLAWYAYPQWLLRTLIEISPNGVSVTLGRVLGSLLFALSLESRAATHYNDFKSKKVVHLSRIMISAPLLLLVLYAGALNTSFNALHLFLGVAAIVVWSLNSVFGYALVTFLELSVDDNNKYNHSSSIDNNKNNFKPWEIVRDSGRVHHASTNRSVLIYPT